MAYGAANIDDLLSPLRRRMNELEEENRRLSEQLSAARRELAELKNGSRITVLVDGKPIATGINIPPELLPTHIPAPPQNYGRPFASPALQEHRPPDVMPLPPGPNGYPAIARPGPEAPNANNGRNGGLDKHFLE